MWVYCTDTFAFSLSLRGSWFVVMFKLKLFVITGNLYVRYW